MESIETKYGDEIASLKSQIEELEEKLAKWEKIVNHLAFDVIPPAEQSHRRAFPASDSWPLEYMFWEPGLGFWVQPLWCGALLLSF